jgi:anti-sigma factor RsiW
MTESTQTTGHLQPDEINAFVDGELSVPGAETVQQHLNDCHACALRVLAASQLKTAVARAGQRFVSSPETLALLAAQLRQPAPAPSGLNPPPPLAPQHSARIVPTRRASAAFIAAGAAIAAALLIAVSLFTWSQFHQANTLAAELLDQHLAMLSGGAVPQVVSTDRHTVKPWFQGRLPFSFNLPDADALPPDTTLRGADLVFLERQPAALLIFTIHKHEVSVFVTQNAGEFRIAPRAARSGFAIRSATAAELRLTAVSDVNPADLDALVNSLVRVQ